MACAPTNLQGRPRDGDSLLCFRAIIKKVSGSQTKPLSQINEEAIQILTRELGTADTARFIQQFTTGEGGYTKERRERLKDTSIDDVMREIKKRRKRRNT